MLSHEKGFATILFILLILVISVGILGGALYINGSKPKVASTTISTSPTPSQTPSPLSPSQPPLIADIHYCNSTAGFCVNIPTNCKTQDIKVGQDESIPAVEFDCPITGQSSPSELILFSSKWDKDFNLNTPQYCSADVCDASDSGIFKSSRKIQKINDITYYFHITAVPTNWSYIYFVSNNLLYTLRYGSNDDPTVLNKILNSFQGLLYCKDGTSQTDCRAHGGIV